MYSGSIHSPGPTNGEKREPTTLNPTIIAHAVDRSTDNGRTLVFSKLNLSDVSAEAAEELATVVRAGPDDDCTIERITLGNNRLTTLPTEFALLSRLRYLNLKHNNFSNFPDVLTVMPSLDTLDISHNKIRRFPAHPGRLVDLRVFSFSKNKVTRLPPYFSQFKRLELLKLDRNPIEWPPRNILQSDIPHDGDKEMKEWIANLLDWVDYNMSTAKAHDDSGYGEAPDWEFSAKQDRHKAWRFPLRDTDADPASLSHNRGFSVDSAVSASSARDDSFIDADSTRNRSPFRPSGYPPIVTAPERSPVRPSEPYLPSPADSEKFDLYSSPSQTDLSDSNRAPPLHLRASSVATESRQSPSTYVPAKKSLPDLRSPQWHKLTDSPEQSFSMFLTNQHDPATTVPSANIRQNSIPSNETRPSRSTPSMAFERNSYFQRLSTMPTSNKLPAALVSLVETARSILFVTSQIYQTIEHYANHAIDEQHSLVFKRVLEPANTDMVNLIRALDLFDSTSQKSLPPPPICRAIVEACRNTVSVTGKAVGMFGIQLGVAPCEDHRYSRWILLELYASTAEISVAWQNLLPHAEDLKPFLHAKLIHRQPLPLLQAPSFGPPNSHPPSGEEHFPALRLRNTDFTSIRTHNARRHAGSFSYRDVELGKVLPSVEEPPIPSLRTPKRQATAPPTAPSLNGSLSLPGPHQPAFSLGRSEGASLVRHNRDHSYEQPPRSAPTSISKLKSLDLPAALRQKPDREQLQSIRQTLDATPKICDMIEDAITPSDSTARELLRKLRDLSRKLSISLRGAEGDKMLDAQMSENVHILFKLVNQLANLVKNGTLSRSASPTLLAQFSRLTESAEEFNKIYGASFPTSSRPYSPLFNHPFSSSASMEDNRLASSLSRTRSAQPTPSLKTSISSFQDGPRSALPTSSFRLPATSRLVSNREGHSDIMDPG